ncbi:hypothetical protein D3C76_1445180 [compost metagenome]
MIGAEVGIDDQVRRLALRFDAQVANVEKVLVVEAVDLAVGDRQIIEHIDAVLLGVADPVDGVDPFQAVELGLKHTFQLECAAGEHAAVGDVEQAFLELGG